METVGAHVRQGKARTSKKMAMLARKRPSWSQIAAPVKGRWGRRAIVQISKDRRQHSAKGRRTHREPKHLCLLFSHQVNIGPNSFNGL